MAHISLRVLILNFGLLAKPTYLNLVKSSLVVLHSPFWLFFPMVQLTFAMPSAPPTGISYTCVPRKESIYSSAKRVCRYTLPPRAHTTLLSLGRVRIYTTGRET